MEGTKVQWSPCGKRSVFLAPQSISGAATDWTSAFTYDSDELVSENPLESHVATENLQVRVTDPGPQHLDERLPGGSGRDPRSRVQHRPALRARPQRQHPPQRRSNLQNKRLSVTVGAGDRTDQEIYYWTTRSCHYRPQRRCEGYVFTGVCLSTGGAWSSGVPGLEGGVWSGGKVPGQGGAWSWGCAGPRGTWSGGGIPACTEADPPGETATAADGMHPNGMHSCLIQFVVTLCLIQFVVTLLMYIQLKQFQSKFTMNTKH